jgi:hypothetical protein
LTTLAASIEAIAPITPHRVLGTIGLDPRGLQRDAFASEALGAKHVLHAGGNGAGKTTAALALAVSTACSDRDALVLTADPADFLRRCVQALGALDRFESFDLPRRHARAGMRLPGYEVRGEWGNVRRRRILGAIRVFADPRDVPGMRPDLIVLDEVETPAWWRGELDSFLRRGCRLVEFRGITG